MKKTGQEACPTYTLPYLRTGGLVGARGASLCRRGPTGHATFLQQLFDLVAKILLLRIRREERSIALILSADAALPVDENHRWHVQHHHCRMLQIFVHGLARTIADRKARMEFRDE